MSYYYVRSLLLLRQIHRSVDRGQHRHCERPYHSNIKVQCVDHIQPNFLMLNSVYKVGIKVTRCVIVVVDLCIYNIFLTFVKAVS